MLRRRIFSAAMASVMALSSVAVVAQAAETTNQVVTKADLEELVTKTYGDSWRADDLSAYGSVSQAAMLDALEAADVILADTDADEEDYTVAYMMVKAVAARLVIHTAEELKALIAECEPIIATNNIYNEELQDQIYTADSFMALEDKLDYAQGFVTSTSSADITEAYEQLLAAKDALKKNAVVSKSMFRNILKKYDEIIDNQFAYDTWRRGSVAWTDLNSGNSWILNNSVDSVAYGHLYQYILSTKGEVVAAYDAIDSIKGLTKTTDADIYEGFQLAQDAVAAYEAWTVDDVNKATKAGLSALINQYHGQLVYDYANTSTIDLFDAIKAVVTAADADATVETMGTDAAAASTATDDLWNTVTVFEDGYGWSANDPAWEHIHGFNKLVEAKAVIKVSSKNVKAVYIPLTDAGYYDDTRDITTDKAVKVADGGKFQTISVGSKFDIATIIDITGKVDGTGDMDSADNNTADTSDEISIWGAGVFTSALPSATWDYGVTLAGAMQIAEVYLYGSKDDIKDEDINPIKNIDDTGVVAIKDGVAVPNGSSKEYQLAYRYLYYALTEQYEGSVAAGCAHTRADVKGLIEDAWDLIDETGDASIFNDANVDLVEARQAAMKWVSAANTDKLYKENTPGTAANGDTYVASDAAYHTLETAYKHLNAEYEALKYSFGEIYDKLAEVAEDIDDGKLDATDALLKAMDDTAYALSCIDSITYTSENAEYKDNAAFDADREFLPNNRLITNTGDAVNINTITAEINDGKDHGVTTKDGANPTHAALATAYNALLDAIKAQAEPEVVLGDANGDGKVTAADATAVLKSIVGLATVDAAAADYNKDGVVNAADATAILKSIVGLN